MDDDCCEFLRCCCECGLCLGLCCLCCKGSNPAPSPYQASGPTVTVTSQPVPQPYPVHGGHGGPPPSGYAGVGQHYPPVMPMPQPGYPPQSGPYPPPHGGYPPAAGPYPPAGYPPQPGFQNQPPPYDVAMSMGPGNPPRPQTEAYGKQAPYNPHYQS